MRTRRSPRRSTRSCLRHTCASASSSPRCAIERRLEMDRRLELAVKKMESEGVKVFRARKFIEEEILTMQCPRCKMAFADTYPRTGARSHPFVPSDLFDHRRGAKRQRDTWISRTCRCSLESSSACFFFGRAGQRRVRLQFLRLVSQGLWWRRVARAEGDRGAR